MMNMFSEPQIHKVRSVQITQARSFDACPADSCQAFDSLGICFTGQGDEEGTLNVFGPHGQLADMFAEACRDYLAEYDKAAREKGETK